MSIKLTKIEKMPKKEKVFSKYRFDILNAFALPGFGNEIINELHGQTASQCMETLMRLGLFVEPKEVGELI